MGQKIITLSGAATDVLYSLFFRGALQSGDLPAKSGAAELRELGFAETRHTATEYQKENYFTFLTAEGQEYAIKHLADTRFGKPVDKQYCSAITIGVELDTSDVQKTIDELDEKIRNSDAFKVLKASMSLCVEGDQRKVAFEADRFKVNEAAQSASNNEETAFNGDLAFGGFSGAISHDGANPADGNNATKTSLNDEMCEAIISAARESDLFTSIQTAIDAQAASTVALQQAVNDVVGDAIRNALKPGGMMWTSFQSCRH